ncbi:Big-1 domain-containing protein [Pseudomonas sp. IT-347P]|uniref:hypothetical protein n=1 Tax=Pseudomonas sp. IT-347P TaxID=3026458 RepID=UPI0039E06ABB
MNEITEEAQGRPVNTGAFDSLTLFKVKFDAAESTQSKELFGNGRMQIKVQVLVAGADANGNAVHVPTEVMDSIKLVHYQTGQSLADGWQASNEQGRFTLESHYTANTVLDSDDDDSVHPQVRTFWVSSAGAGETQVAARLTFNQQVIRSNGTTLSSVHDSSVTLIAKAPVAYSIDSFRWQQVRRGNEEPGNRIWNYYLGLYPPGGQQIRLVDWAFEGERGNHTFAWGNKLYEWKTNYLNGTLVLPEPRYFNLVLPYAGDPIAFTLFSDAIATQTKSYKVAVNDRDGELTVVQALSEYSTVNPKSRHGDVFHFRAIDQYGTEHKLAIHTDFEERSFSLARG